MDEWQTMFGQVQGLTREALPLKQSLERVIAFARSNPVLFDEPEFWGRAQGHDFRAAFATLTSWAKQGLQAPAPHAGWQFLLLDLGDCPETFRLYSPGGQGRMSQERFRNIMLGGLIVGPSDMESCFGPDEPDPFGLLFGPGRADLSDHHVSELGDGLLDWTGSAEAEFHGNSGYLLWLLLGSLALVVPLRDAAYCKAILGGRDRLYLLSGYEEIFFYVATVTPEGILYETA